MVVGHDQTYDYTFKAEPKIPVRGNSCVAQFAQHIAFSFL